VISVRRTRTLWLALALVVPTRMAFAQGEGNAAAEALFQEGRALFEQGKFAEGCPKLAESQRIDPATGTLLALALCHEGEGKLATAWAEFTTVAGQARSAGREDREALAREHAALLRPRLSTLTIDVSPELTKTPGVSIRVDGVVMGAGSYGIAVPVDGGEHRVEASAPNRKPWSAVVTVKSESDAVRVAVPVLADAPQTTAPKTTLANDTNEPTSSGGSGMGTAGLVTAGAGVVVLGIGTYLALDAKSDYDAADERCEGATCPSGPFEATEDARSQGTIATVLFAVGGAAIATGAVLWFLPPTTARDAPSARVRVERVGFGPSGVNIAGSFR
jgi:hypothetical protein